MSPAPSSVIDARAQALLEQARVELLKRRGEATGKAKLCPQRSKARSILHAMADTRDECAQGLQQGLASLVASAVPAEIQTEGCPECQRVCAAGWCGVCHKPISEAFDMREDYRQIQQILGAEMTGPDGPLPEPKQALGPLATCVYGAVQ